MKILHIFLVVTIIIVIYLLFQKPFSNDCKSEKSSIIKTLTRQAARWSTAAAQDENPMIAVLHANYGAGFLWALRDIATDKEIEEMGINVLKFRDEITKIQDIATVKMIGACPRFGPKTTYLTKLAGEM